MECLTVHILFGFRSSQSLSDLMQDIKGSSSKWITMNGFCSNRLTISCLTALRENYRSSFYLDHVPKGTFIAENKLDNVGLVISH
jgi:hypothetical protein